jgi:hypothetical protein
MTNDKAALAATNSRATALTTTAVALLVALAVVLGPAALPFAELIGAAIVHVVRAIFDFQVFLAVRVGNAVAWVVLQSWR